MLIWFTVMGCIPSKPIALIDDNVQPATRGRRRHRILRDEKLASPIIPSDAPPWVTGQKVLTRVDGELLIREKEAVREMRKS